MQKPINDLTSRLFYQKGYENIKQGTVFVI